jgi:hypothetical protein
MRISVETLHATFLPIPIQIVLIGNHKRYEDLTKSKKIKRPEP